MNKYSIQCRITFSGRDIDELTSQNFFVSQMGGDLVFLKCYEPKSDHIGELTFFVSFTSRNLESAMEWAFSCMAKSTQPEHVRKKWCEILKVFNETEGCWENLPDDNN